MAYFNEGEDVTKYSPIFTCKLMLPKWLYFLDNKCQKYNINISWLSAYRHANVLARI